MHARIEWRTEDIEQREELFFVYNADHDGVIVISYFISICNLLHAYSYI